MRTKQTKEKAEACKHTQNIQMLKTKNEKQIISAMLISLLVHFAPVLKYFNVTKRILFISVFMLLFRCLMLIKMLKTH